jgi:hypothetical protein
MVHPAALRSPESSWRDIVTKPNLFPLRIFPALTLAALAVATSFAAVASCAGTVAAAQDLTGAPAAPTPAGTAPAPNPFAGLKPVFT